SGPITIGPIRKGKSRVGTDLIWIRPERWSDQTLLGRGPNRLLPSLVTRESTSFSRLHRSPTNNHRGMAKGGNEKNGRSSANQTNPEAEERKRLRKLAISKNLLSEFPAKASSLSLNPSKTVIKHHGRDILRKSNRKNRFLFSFPGLLAPVSGGKVGELKDLGSKNPILYLDFPQGRMKLFGTIVYPKNRYLTLQFSKGGKNVMCEDYFDT
ncbi:hypothetical protein Ccrd_014161, partial [Cynara cardunculus var. scolymus]